MEEQNQGGEPVANDDNVATVTGIVPQKNSAQDQQQEGQEQTSSAPASNVDYNNRFKSKILNNMELGSSGLSIGTHMALETLFSKEMKIREICECKIFGVLQEINPKWFDRDNVSLYVSELNNVIFVDARLLHQSKPHQTQIANIEFSEIVKSSGKRLIVNILLEHTEIDCTDEMGNFDEEKDGINKNYFHFNGLKIVDEAVKSLADML